MISNEMLMQSKSHYKNGEDEAVYNSPCYAYVDWSKDVTVYHPFPEATSRRLVQWILNDSMFAPWFLTKDVDEGLEEGYRINCDLYRKGVASRQDMVFGVSSLRQQYEYENKDVFDQAVDAGFSEREAFFLTQHFLCSKAGWIAFSHNTNHLTLHHYLKLKDFTADKFKWGHDYVQGVFSFSAGSVENWYSDYGDTLHFKTRGPSHFRSWVKKEYEDLRLPDFKAIAENINK